MPLLVVSRGLLPPYRWCEGGKASLVPGGARTPSSSIAVSVASLVPGGARTPGSSVVEMVSLTEGAAAGVRVALASLVPGGSRTPGSSIAVSVASLVPRGARTPSSDVETVASLCEGAAGAVVASQVGWRWRGDLQRAHTGIRPW